MIKTCKLCGEQFEATTNAIICSKPHFRRCIICGEEFQVTTSSIGRQTCSRKCTNTLANQSRSITHAKKSEMNLDPNKTKSGRYLKVCVICGEEFHTASKVRVLCYKPHTRACCICGKEFPLNVYASSTLTCSSKCASDLRTQRNLEKYGVRSTLELEETKKKIRQTNLQKYGTEVATASPVVQERIKQTNIQKFGVPWAIQSKEVQAKSQETCLERYGVPWGCVSDQAKQKTIQTNLERRGVEHVFQDPEFQAQSRQACLERYGTEHYVQSEDFKEKAQATWMDHYGVDNPLKSSEIQKRAEVTSMVKYGTRRPQQSDEIRGRIRQTNIENHADSILDEDRKREFLKFKLDPVTYLSEHLPSSKGMSHLAYTLGYADPTVLWNEVHENGLENLVPIQLPRMEQEVISFIQSIDSNVNMILHDRKLIHPLEVDIYLPDHGFAIECNPTATHNSTFVLANILGDLESPPTEVKYHEKKSMLCKDKGIFLLHIFGYEWSNRRPVMQSIIRNLMHKPLNRYFARKLDIREVSANDAYKFLTNNHKQGGINTAVRLGLYDNDDLVSLMTFNKIRKTMGSSKFDTDYTWELDRFCSKLNSVVVGGASKLFKHFISNYDFDRLVTFSDVAHMKGDLYPLLGFQAINKSEPNYVWVNLTTDMYFHRVSCQKRFLPKLLGEPDLDIQNQTEQQIMASHGFVQVFDSGTIRWEYTK